MQTAIAVMANQGAPPLPPRRQRATEGTRDSLATRAVLDRNGSVRKQRQFSNEERVAAGLRGFRPDRILRMKAAKPYSWAVVKYF